MLAEGWGTSLTPTIVVVAKLEIRGAIASYLPPPARRFDVWWRLSLTDPLVPTCSPIVEPSGVEHQLQPINCPVDALVLPCPDHRPSECDQCLGIPAVASHVRRKLLSPPGSVVPWCGAMLWAAVPEAAVDEHDDLRAGEDDVPATSQAGLRAIVDPEAVALRMEPAAYLEFERRVASTLRLHPPSDVVVEGFGAHGEDMAST